MTRGFTAVQGRILVFSVHDCKLHLVCEKEVRGAVYSVNPFQVPLPIYTTCSRCQ